MVPLQLLTVLLALSLQNVIADEPPATVSKCVELALNRGDSPEGWSVVNNKFCEQKISRLVCATGVNFFNALKEGENDCCDPPKKVTWQNDLARSGWCCNPGETWIGDKEMNKGRCCPDGSTLVDGVCEKPKNLSPPDRQERREFSERGCCSCFDEHVCANKNDLGIKYGSCYVLTFSDGKQLGRNRDDYYYVKDGYLQDIPFKVCKQATDCTAAGAVAHGGSFVLEDQVGGIREDLEVKGWITDHINGKLLHLTFSPHSAGNFHGTATFSGGSCSIRVTSPSNGGGGLGYAFSTATPGLSFFPNKKAGLSLHFREVDCEGGVLGLHASVPFGLHRQHSSIYDRISNMW